MKRLLGALLALSLTTLLAAQDKPRAETKHNTLTPNEVADGWLLLFDGATTFGWQVEGEARVEKGVLILGGDRPTKAQVTTAFAGGRVALESTWEGKAAPTLRAGFFRGAIKGIMGKGFGSFSISWFATGAAPQAPLAVEVPAGTRVLLRNLKFQPAGTRPLFNGKDLTGWKLFKGKGKKSKFTVTKEGWLNVKDGPGDLQTEKLFDDFVLQLECISNGKHLNSGIFFRCIPGQYQNGYEAQIRNQFTPKPTQTYTVEEYDPKTHKLLGKNKVKSPAIDYGTGAIYRRMPTRSEVARDGEWFTLTVVARGRHLATWVNGIQQVDWTDNRPDSANPRNGYRAEKGAISIQGHDPTTDLSFRNFRIAELPRPKSKAKE
jgi:hypothetical protein